MSIETKCMICGKPLEDTVFLCLECEIEEDNNGPRCILDTHDEDLFLDEYMAKQQENINNQ